MSHREIIAACSAIHTKTQGSLQPRFYTFCHRLYGKMRLRTGTRYVCCCYVMELETWLFSDNACVNKRPAQANVRTHVPVTHAPSSLLASANTFSPLRYQIDLKANHWQPLHLSIHIPVNSLNHFLTRTEPYLQQSFGGNPSVWEATLCPRILGFPDPSTFLRNQHRGTSKNTWTTYHLPLPTFANHAAHLIVVNVSWEGISRYLHMEELADIGHSVWDSPQFLYWCRCWMGVQPTEGLLFLRWWRLKGKVFLWVRRSHYQGHGQPQNGTNVPQPDLSHVTVSARHVTSWLYTPATKCKNAFRNLQVKSISQRCRKIYRV